MKNPIRDEASAFRVVFLTLGGAVLVAVAAWINTWLGLVVFLVLVAAGFWAIRGGMRPRPPQAHVVRDEGPARRILVVANETVAGSELHDLLGQRAADVAEEVLVVCPALNSKLHTWLSDEDGARAEARIASMRASPASTTRGSPPVARSATGTRSRRSRMPFASSPPTRSSSRPIRPAARTGSSRASSNRRACASTCR